MQRKLCNVKGAIYFTDFCDEAAHCAMELIQDKLKVFQRSQSYSLIHKEANPFRNPTLICKQDNRLPSFSNGFIFGFEAGQPLERRVCPNYPSLAAIDASVDRGTFDIGNGAAKDDETNLHDVENKGTETLSAVTPFDQLYDPLQQLKHYVANHASETEKLISVRALLVELSNVGKGWSDGFKDTNQSMKLLLLWGKDLSASEWAFVFHEELEHAKFVHILQPMPRAPSSLPSASEFLQLLRQAQLQQLAEMVLFNILPPLLREVEGKYSKWYPKEGNSSTPGTLPSELSYLLYLLFHQSGLRDMLQDERKNASAIRHLRESLCKSAPRFGPICLNEIEMLNELYVHNEDNP